MEQQLTPPACKVCGTSNPSAYLTCKDHFLSQEVFTLLRCPNCKVCTTTPQPKKDDISRYYASDNYVSHSDSKKGVVNTMYQLVKKVTLRQKIQLVKAWAPEQTLLDYGCGTGDFAVYCSQHNWETVGLEPDHEARSLAAQKGLTTHPLEWLSTTKRLFGAITLWHVLEHTYDPMAVLERLSDHLSPGGVLIVAVPNYTSFDAQHYRSNWAAYDVPRHLFHFHPDTMQHIAAETHLSLVYQKGMVFDAFYVSMLSEKYKGGHMLLGVLNGARSNHKALKTGNYSSMIYVLQKQAL